MPDNKPIHYRIVDRSRAQSGDERARVVAALLEDPPRIEPKYFYDDLGCALYGAICLLPEYYPTRTEAALFRDRREEISRVLGTGRQFVDLGSGDCRKAQGWLPFLTPSRYVAVDFAAGELERSLARLSPEFPRVEMVGVVADFTAGLPLDGVLDGSPATFFYPGSSIGNFTPDEAVAFLSKVRAYCAPRAGGLLIGVDGKKASAVLDAAYDDPLGVTAAFNRNVLVHLNRRFAFNFDPGAFVHRGFYNAEAGRVEMHLESAREQEVDLAGSKRRFEHAQRIHTENSCKYRPEEFEALLGRAGFGSVRHWTSAENSYYVFYATA